MSREWRKSVSSDRRNHGGAAHLFVDGRPACPRPGSGSMPVEYVPTDVTEYGTPYGRTCDRCLKVYRGHA
jgi:hypothetical protein